VGNLFLATSSLTVNDILISLTGFIVFYTGLAIVEGWLMLRFVKIGPSSLHTGKYHFEHLDDHTNGDQITDEQGAKS
jgi:cytochrome d ubiquinol oxidase subunit I